MRDHALVVARSPPIFESFGQGRAEHRRFHCRDIDRRDRSRERFDRNYMLRLGVLADLQADKNERCQHADGADDLCEKRKLLECHCPENSRAPRALHRGNSFGFHHPWRSRAWEIYPLMKIEVIA